MNGRRVRGVGGPPLATLTCLATVVVAYTAGVGAEAVLEKLKALLQPAPQVPVH